MDKDQLIKDLFPPHVPGTQELLDRLLSDKIRPLEQSITDRTANFEAEIAADKASLADLYAIADQLQIELSPAADVNVEDPVAEGVTE